LVRPDDTLPWDLLHDGRLVAIERAHERVRLTIEVPHLGREFVVRLEGVETLGWLPYSERWDEPLVEDPAGIVAAKPIVAEAQWRERERTMIVWGSLGSLRLGYSGLEIEGVTLDELRAQVDGYWQRWREHWQGREVHPLVHEAGRCEWTPAFQGELIAAWRGDRTSDLAETIVIVDEVLRGSEALAGLVKRADTWGLLLDDPRPYEEVEVEHTRIWGELREAVGELGSAEPDPRIGRAIEGMLRGPSNDWFRPDQVAHVIGRPDKIDDRPSFADRALALLDVHGDAGSVGRLRDKARRLLIEADCNTAEMSERLTTLAEKLAARWPRDRVLPDAVAQALRVRALPLLLAMFMGGCTEGAGSDSDEGLASAESYEGDPVPDLGDDGSPEAGCTKVDLLFVIDDSHSMAVEQGVLIASFPEFIASVRESLDAVDSYHIGVVTTDAYPSNAPECRQLGALVTATGGAESSASECGPFGSGRFMTEDDPLEADFACAARVGIEGSDDERPIAALLAAVGPELAQGCNEGFLRPDALLVVVIITDEEDDHTTVMDQLHGTPGDPADWFEQFEQAIGTEHNAAILLIAGGLPDNTCGFPVGVGAEDAPRLREFTRRFTHSMLGDVCAYSYAPVFEETLDFVERACAAFVPVP
jgi:hypothetical protein